MQAQRLTIARAILRKTPIIIFDEATSALDSKTEMNVLKAIGKLSPARTCIIITHRASTLSICHCIFRIEDGNMFETTKCNDATTVKKELSFLN